MPEDHADRSSTLERALYRRWRGGHWGGGSCDRKCRGRCARGPDQEISYHGGSGQSRAFEVVQVEDRGDEGDRRALWRLPGKIVECRGVERFEPPKPAAWRTPANGR